MCFTNVNEAGIRYRYFMYSTNKCTDFNKNITLFKKKKKKKKKKKLFNYRTGLIKLNHGITYDDLLFQNTCNMHVYVQSN